MMAEGAICCQGDRCRLTGVKSLSESGQRSRMTLCSQVHEAPPDRFNLLN